MSCFYPKTVNIYLDYSGSKPKHVFKYSPVDFDPTLKVAPKFSLTEAMSMNYFNGSSDWRWFGQVPCPCKQCLGCRLDYAKKWRDRMLIESLSHDEPALFLTLTYNDDHLPKLDNGLPTLRMDDLTGFWKRLRNYFPGKKLMYYVSGEYGSVTDRPHYHAIVFGISLPESWFEVYKYTREGNVLYKSDKLSNIWSYGFVTFGIANAKTMSYVARYTAKKVGNFDFNGKDKGREPPQSRCSLKPGIGLRYFEDHPDVINQEFIHIGLKEGSFKIPVPDYYIRKYKESLSDDALDDYVTDKCSKVISHWESIFQNTDLSAKDYFHDNERRLRKKAALLIRDEV